ncbi:hypothetical protein N7495_001010 [Penicillium taxi]|uniref:uncharacterized protein n=1 Tax=Penicillium taxi TaxID=168475 RepID=UPI0025457F80|nr:uncharacterized protein N7495_001010 [Penicillium taxi]KAJ5908328.1 hypothetical protein N7495_001010 [Penicillium taxi]
MESKKTPSITIYRGFLDSGCYVWSPFVVKLELRLRIGRLNYRTEPGSVTKAPRGKIPYLSIERANGVETLSDSTLIAKSLVESGDLGELNKKLSPTEKLNDLALIALLEDKLYFCNSNEKWIHNYYTMRSKVLAAVPWPLQLLVGYMVYNKMVRTLQGQGTGKFTDEEIESLCKNIYEALNGHVTNAQVLNREKEGPFWLWGDSPSEADTVLFGFLAGTLVCDAAPASQKMIKSYPALMEYARRIHYAYFPDYPIWG